MQAFDGVGLWGKSGLKSNGEMRNANASIQHVALTTAGQVLLGLPKGVPIAIFLIYCSAS